MQQPNQPISNLFVVREISLIRSPLPLNGVSFTTGTGTFNPLLIEEKSFNNPTQSIYPFLYNLNYLESGTSQYTTSFLEWVQSEEGLEGFRDGDFIHMAKDEVLPARGVEFFSRRLIGDEVQWFRYNQTILSGDNFDLTQSITNATQISQGYSRPQMSVSLWHLL